MALSTGRALRHPQSSASSRVTPATVERAVNALLKWKDSKSKTQKPQLLEQDDFMYLVLTLKKIPPKSRTNAYKIPLPHPLHESSTSELCLIIDDRPHNPKKLTSDDAKKKIKSEDIPISKVVKLSKLKSDYKPFEAKRKLCDSYDMFFADKRVVPLLPKLLGKQFFKKKKIPVPVDLTHNNWKEQIEKGCSSALLYLRTGTCSVVRVGKVSMERGEIVENVIAAIDGAVEEVVPKKLAGLRSLHLKFSESLALPIYQALPDMKLKIEGLLPEKEESVGVELEEIKEDSSKKDEKLGGKKKGSSSKKGRIHEVRYMDAIDIDQEQELGGDDDEKDDYESEQSGDDELGSADSEGKKRKKRDYKTKGQVLSELKPSKKLAKVENGDGKEHKKGGLLILEDGEESGGRKEKKKKKKKSGLGKLKDETVKAKVKKSSKKKQSV
ncbi:putative ribosome biogenesis protein C8F11.04 [Cornus florida]|uniref:putative ribosome biogenesis protein C8F11.04 n=1 Tax=Cornus florida TaxID=4283 RepID=UPI002897AA60|nr:putative ribosome biogenesis protein C8F11.04 [Cornus florida]